jgi:hypothetical protein
MELLDAVSNTMLRLVREQFIVLSFYPTGNATPGLQVPSPTAKNNCQVPGCWFAGTTKFTCSTPICPGARPRKVVVKAGVVAKGS